MGNRSRSESKRSQKKTPPHQTGGSSSSSSSSGSSSGSRATNTIDSTLSDLNGQVRELTASRIASEKDYDRARREFLQAVRDWTSAIDEEQRRTFASAKAELDVQRQEVRRVAEEAAHHQRFLQEEVQQLRDRIAEATKHSPYELPTLEGQLEQLQPLLDDARQAHGASRQELKLIQKDLLSLSASKRFADKERRSYHQEMTELDLRDKEWDEFDKHQRKLDAAWERSYRRDSTTEERAQQQELPLDLP